MPIGRDLRAKRFFITGATGFLGTALVERILRCIPEADITVLVRPGRRADPAARLAREVIRNDCFDRLRSELGDNFAPEVARRVKAVAGDVGQDGLGLDEAGRAALAASDVVIHSAATVSFDAPLTQAVEINLLGPARVAEAIAASGSRAHLISVSTAYVASTHQGEAKEELLSENRFTLDIDWEEEVKAARRLRDDLQAASRQPGRLTAFTKEARGEIGGAGDHLIATRAEKIREEWVRTELVDAGTARALRSGGPMPTPSPRPWANASWSSNGPGNCRSPSSGPPSSSPLFWSLGPGGSAGSGWRSRSSCRTHAACCVSSPEYPKASSTSSRWTWWSPPFWPSPPTARTPTVRACSTWPRACATPSPTGTWSTWRRTGSAATRSTTSGGNRSACPNGRSPAAAGCSANCAGPIRS